MSAIHVFDAPRCWAEIDSRALSANLEAIPVDRSKVVAVVKADAYGHGVELVAPVVAKEGVTHFGVATAAEGVRLRAILDDLGARGEIYVMAAVLPAEAASLIAAQLTPFCCDFELARALSEHASANGGTASVHVEVDTGIGRAGVLPDEVPAFVDALRGLPSLAVTGICTHFTAADSLDGPADAFRQYALFEGVLNALGPTGLKDMAIHAANSPATLRVPRVRSHLVRPGLLLYGIGPTAPLAQGAEAPFPYRPVLSLHARALLVRRMPAGSDISYNRTYRLDRDAVIATIGIGYGDGFPRRLSNQGHALLSDGTQVPMRGRICMDQFCVELPDTATVAPGDPITLIGSCGSSRITALEIADTIGTTPHEIVTCLTARVPRMLAP